MIAQVLEENSDDTIGEPSDLAGRMVVALPEGESAARRGDGETRTDFSIRGRSRANTAIHRFDRRGTAARRRRKAEEPRPSGNAIAPVGAVLELTPVRPT